jgi:DNA-directed RNA polymerase subunit N (RpoN/RPB10)
MRPNCPDSILAMSSTVLMIPRRCLPFGADAGERIDGFLGQFPVKALLDQLGVAKGRCKRGPQLVAHVGNELLKLTALVGDLVE